MSQHHKEDDGFFTTVVVPLFKLIFGTARFLVQTSMLLMFFLFKRPLSRKCNLERHSANWANTDIFYLTIKWIAAGCFLMMAVKASQQFKVMPFETTQVVLGVLYSCAALAFALVFNLIHWIGQYARDPDIQKKMAGIDAEHYVQTLIENNQQQFPSAKSLHGKLFVFNADLPNEFSVEADHIVITERNIFVIETKSKSGTISAGADNPRWNVSSKHGDTKMQNALKQAKNAARVLFHQVNLPCELVPLVAIKGCDVKIIDGPSNVSSAENIVEIMCAFEQSKPHPKLNPTAIQSLLETYIKTDTAAMERHIERAQAARKRAEQREIVDAASIQ